MLMGIFFFLFLIQGVVPQTRVTGFELLDNFYSGHVPAGDSVVQAKTPFSTQLAICYWFFQPWARTHAHMGSFELRTTLTQRRREIPSNSNWPNVYGWIAGSKMSVQSVKGFEFQNKTANINFLRKWTHVCYSFDFLANEFQLAMNGEVQRC